MKVTIHLLTQSLPIVRTNVKNAYEKGSFYCIMLQDREDVEKFPIMHIFRVKEETV